jgi:hypothetical protein
VQLFDEVSREAFMLKYRLTEALIATAVQGLEECCDVGLFRHEVTDLLEAVDLAEIDVRPTVGL